VVRDIEIGHSPTGEQRRHVKAANMSKIPVAPLAVSPRDAARMMGVSRSRVYELMGAGELDAFKDGARTLILVASIEAWLARLKRYQTSPPTEPLLPLEDRALARERVEEPDFAALFAKDLERLTPNVGEAQARVRALANTIRAYRKYHELDFKPASAAVRALIVAERPVSANQQQLALERALSQSGKDRPLPLPLDEPLPAPELHGWERQ
jgi:excisionase family DNA binding protein